MDLYLLTEVLDRFIFGHRQQKVRKGGHQGMQ